MNLPGSEERFTLLRAIQLSSRGYQFFCTREAPKKLLQLLLVFYLRLIYEAWPISGADSLIHQWIAQRCFTVSRISPNTSYVIYMCLQSLQQHIYLFTGILTIFRHAVNTIKLQKRNIIEQLLRLVGSCGARKRPDKIGHTKPKTREG